VCVLWGVFVLCVGVGCGGWVWVGGGGGVRVGGGGGEGGGGGGGGGFEILRIMKVQEIVISVFVHDQQV